MFKFDAQAMRSTLAIRLRFLQDRANRRYMSPGEIDSLSRELGDIERDMARVEKGESILCAGRELLMGYFSDLDDTDQPYKLYIPEEYDGTKPFPLAVYLHGQMMFNPLQCSARPIGKMIVVAPQSRGGMDYRYVGETDTLCVLDQVQRMLRIDPDRIYLCGESMGGTGSWQLAAMFPDRFAGIVPVCGAADIRVWERQWLWTTPQDSPICKVRDFLRDDTSSLTYAENLEHVSVVCLQGVCDPIVNELQAKHMQEALKAFGHAKNEFHFFPYVMHSFSVNYNVALQNFVREERPLHVHYKTAWLKYPGAHWLKIGAIEQRLKHATIDGTADPKKRSIKIKTTNAAQISIERARLPFTDSLSRVTIDGDSIDSPPEKHGAYSFSLLDGKWKAEKERSKSSTFPPKKNQRIEGPAEHAFMSRFLLVADSGEAPMLDAIDDAAETFNDHWRQRYAVSAKRKKPSEVTDQDVADSNLILFGCPEDNALTAKVIGKLPISFDGEKITLGDKTYGGPNAGATVCYPNPLNPERYVVLIAGTTPQSYIDINVRFGNWFDWVPYDFRKHYDFAVFDDLTSGRNPESFLVWGFFDENWNLSDALTFAAVKSFREKLLPRVFPRIAADTADKPDELWLDDAFTDHESFTKEYLERNRTLEGHVLQLMGKEYKRGLCCRFPCWLTFNCEGYSRLKLSAGVGWDRATEPCDDRKQFEKVRVLIQGDGKTLYEALDRTYKMEPCEIDVDLNGASSVTLSATGGLAWLNGSFVWANARLEH